MAGNSAIHEMRWGAHAPGVQRLTPSSTASLRATAERRAEARVISDREGACAPRLWFFLKHQSRLSRVDESIRAQSD